MYRKSLHLLALLCLALAFCTLFAACGSTIEPTDTTEETDDCLLSLIHISEPTRR